MFDIHEKIPKNGYILEDWEIIGYRATAYAYLKRKKYFFVKHTNGKTYNINQIKNALIK